MATDLIKKSKYSSYSSLDSKSTLHILNTKVSTVVAIFVYVFLLFENPLESVIPGLGYFDEFLFLFMVVISAINCREMTLYLGKECLTVIVLSFFIVLLGLFGNWTTEFQLSVEAILKEILAFLKFPIGTISALFIFRKSESDKVVSGCDFVAKLFVIVCACFALVNLMVPNAGFGHDVRHGVMSYKFIFSHPTFLVFSLVMAFVALEAKKRGITMFKLICLGLLALTMRDKAFGFIGFIVAVWIFNIGNKKKLFPYLILSGLIVLFAAWPKIAEYISYSNSPRQSLYGAAFRMSVSYFPFGGGLASIASSLSGEFYSGAYSFYGLNNMVGLTPFDYFDTGDAGFAYYLGQFGLLGFLLFLLVLFIIYKMTVLRLPLGSPRRSSVLYIFAYLLISLTVEASLTNATGIMAAVLIALMCGDAVSTIEKNQFSSMRG